MVIGSCCLCSKQLFPQSRHVRCAGPCLSLICSHCLNVPPAGFKEWKSLNAAWTCGACSNPPSSSVDLHQRIKDLESKLTDALGRISYLEDRVAALALTTVTLPPVALNSSIASRSYAAALSSTNAAGLIHDIRSEERKQADLAHNIVIRGLQSFPPDVNLITAHADFWPSISITREEIVSAKAIGSSNLIKVTLKDLSTVATAIRLSPSLKHSPLYRKVYINRDLTRAEQELNFSLRCQLREKRTLFPSKTFILRNGTIRELPIAASSSSVLSGTPAACTSALSTDPTTVTILPPISSDASSTACSSVPSVPASTESSTVPSTVLSPSILPENLPPPPTSLTVFSSAASPGAVPDKSLSSSVR